MYLHTKRIPMTRRSKTKAQQSNLLSDVLSLSTHKIVGGSPCERSLFFILQGFLLLVNATIPRQCCWHTGSQ
jgi:hypothetical protein